MESTKDLQIGLLVGDKVVNMLPTLSTDMLNSDFIIEVSVKLSDEWHNRNDKWIKSTRTADKELSSKIFYENLAWYKENIEKVYLPEEKEFIIRDYYLEEFNEEMIKGFNEAIWDCDLSHYTYFSHEISNFGSFLKIKMKYDR